MAGLCEGGNEPSGSLKAICKNIIDLVDEFRATVCTERKKSVRWPTKMTEDAVEDARERMQRSPNKSVKKLAVEIGISYGSAHEILRNKLGVTTDFQPRSTSSVENPRCLALLPRANNDYIPRMSKFGGDQQPTLHSSKHEIWERNGDDEEREGTVIIMAKGVRGTRPKHIALSCCLSVYRPIIGQFNPYLADERHHDMPLILMGEFNLDLTVNENSQILNFMIASKEPTTLHRSCMDISVVHYRRYVRFKFVEILIVELPRVTLLRGPEPSVEGADSTTAVASFGRQPVDCGALQSGAG
ncbi:hypothetical protein ANN_17167 [Periplaneta americana]|uniref:Uncharacterized protein n=1 Tax=Periplaneta americana TaxID=6978 RepID=A0ABQ8SSS4_PERAM|nr:hypothetical protein ANN_17167 [Periplaneta americana]